MVFCRLPGCTNQADKDFNIIMLVTIIVMMLQLYSDIIRAMAYLMPATYSKHCQISKMMRHIENPGIVTTSYSDIFRYIQGHAELFVALAYTTMPYSEPWHI